MIKGAIFDLDGTLLDSMGMWENAGQTYLRSIGYEPKSNLREAIKPLSLYQTAEYFKIEYGVALSVDEIMDGVNAMIAGFYKDEAELKPFVKDFLKQLSEAGVKMCVATATDLPLVESALKRCGIEKYFEKIFTCTLVGHGKDEPHIYRAALEYLATYKENTVVFEDALHTVKTAKADGFKVAAVYDAYENNPTMMKSIADIYISSFDKVNSFWKFASAL